MTRITYMDCPFEVTPRSPAAAAIIQYITKNAGDTDSLEGLFELLDRARTSDPDAPEFGFPSPMARAVVHYFDDIALGPSRIVRYAAISRTVVERAEYFPRGVKVAVIYPASNLPEFRSGRQAHFFTVGRFDGAKRVELLVRAFSLTRTKLPFKICGTGPLQRSIQELVARDPRVELLGFVKDRDLIDLYADSLAVLYAPWQEDYGLVTIEAMMSGKPVVTTTDAGGPLEFIEDGVTGLTCAAEPSAIASQIDRFAAQPDSALAMGAAARARVAPISWRSAVAALLDEAPAGCPPVRSHRSKITVAATFPIYRAGCFTSTDASRNGSMSIW